METATLIVIPSYWCKGGPTKEDIVYDHPTDLLKKEETLSRTLKSLTIIDDNFDVLVVGVPTRACIGKEMDNRLQELIKRAKLPFRLIYCGYGHLLRLKDSIRALCTLEEMDIISNKGYGNIRNLGLFISHLLGYDIVIMIDDDELIDDRYFIKKATEFIGKDMEGKILGLVAGYYRNNDGSIFLDESKVMWWQLVWNKPRIMNEAFKITINGSNNHGDNRLVNTPFAFGGNLVIHRKCWKVVPFDPKIARGEDMDYLRNVKHYGFSVKLDRKLSIVHLPPETTATHHEKFIQDALRFLYASKKAKRMGINPDDYDPYPGYFLKGTEGKVLLTELLYMIYQDTDDILKINHVQDLVYFLKEKNPFFEEACTNAEINSGSYMKFQAIWVNLLEKIGNSQSIIKYCKSHLYSNNDFI
ncbi:MAG: hypothetical protein ACTSP4_02100 [Candidatus Hodarchaeales archaeon]